MSCQAEIPFEIPTTKDTDSGTTVHGQDHSLVLPYDSAIDSPNAAIELRASAPEKQNFESRGS